MDGCVDREALWQTGAQVGRLLRDVPNFLNKGRMVFFETTARRGQLGERRKGSGLPK